MNNLPSRADACPDCGVDVLAPQDGVRCPACFDQYLYSLDVGFLARDSRGSPRVLTSPHTGLAA